MSPNCTSFAIPEIEFGSGFAAHIARSDYSGSNTKLPKILLNGNNICMVTTNSSGELLELTLCHS